MTKSGFRRNSPPVVLISLFLLSGLAGPGYCDAIGRYGAEFMAAGGGARALGLGGSNVALANDAWALFWNPAGLCDVTASEAGLMHSERFDGVVDYDAVAFAMRQGDGSILAAGMIRLGVNGIPFTRKEFPGSPLSNSNRVQTDRIVNSGDYAFFAAKAECYRRWRWGVAPKLIFRHVGSDLRAYGLGVDAGVQAGPLPSLPLQAGIAVRDLFGTLLAWEQTGRKEIIPSTVRIGMAAMIDLPPLEAKITPVADLSYRFEVFGGSDAAALHLGAEYLLREVVALRIGSDDGRLTLGGGLELEPVSLDYAFIGHDELGNTHRISVTARWGR